MMNGLLLFSTVYCDNCWIHRRKLVIGEELKSENRIKLALKPHQHACQSVFLPQSISTWDSSSTRFSLSS